MAPGPRVSSCPRHTGRVVWGSMGEASFRERQVRLGQYTWWSLHRMMDCSVTRQPAWPCSHIAAVQLSALYYFCVHCPVCAPHG